MLGVDASTIKRMCASGRLHSFKTTGGHWRIAIADIEAVQRGDANGDNMRRPTTSSPFVQHRRESLEEVRLLIDEKKARVTLEELEDQERQRREQKEAARREAENEARREQREREAEQARQDRERKEREQQREAFERRQKWVDEQVEFALKSAPPDVAGRFASEIQLSVEDALQGLAPSRPKPLVERVVCGAVDRVLQPWAREQQRKQDIATGANEAANPLYVPGLWGNRECEIRAREQALKAILALPESVRFDQMVVVGCAAAQRAVQEYEQQQKQQRDQQERERAHQKREQEIDGYLFNVAAVSDGTGAGPGTSRRRLRRSDFPVRSKDQGRHQTETSPRSFAELLHCTAVCPAARRRMDREFTERAPEPKELINVLLHIHHRQRCGA
jgi:hypothetical protein